MERGIQIHGIEINAHSIIRKHGGWQSLAGSKACTQFETKTVSRPTAPSLRWAMLPFGLSLSLGNPRPPPLWYHSAGSRVTQDA